MSSNNNGGNNNNSNNNNDGRNNNNNRRRFPNFIIESPAADDSASGSDMCDSLGLEDHCDMRLDDGGVWTVGANTLTRVAEIGRGRYGAVDEMVHNGSNTTLAVKRIRLRYSITPTDEELQFQKSLQIELEACMASKICEHLVHFYGSFSWDGDVWICMERLDTCLDKFYRICEDRGIVRPEPFLAIVAKSVLCGLSFMKKTLNLLHRDVKPSNVLLKRNGQVKLCDFGISGRLIDSMAKTYEIAAGSHPYGKWHTWFDQLKQLAEYPAPTLPVELNYSPLFHNFIHLCLTKDHKRRPKFDALLQHEFLKLAYAGRFDAGAFVELVLEQFEDNQPDYLQPENVMQVDT